MTMILLAGADAALLEGLCQTLAALAHKCEVAHTLADARTIALATPPLLVIAGRELVEESPGEALTIPLAPGGALVVYRTIGSLAFAIPPMLHRLVMAELTLPLERNRLVALVQSVHERTRATGRLLDRAPGDGATTREGSRAD